MKTKHTPGPWNCADRFKSSLRPVTSKHVGKRKPVASIHYDELPEQEVSANAKLIAAAPELLEALIMAQDTLKAAIGGLYSEWPECNVIESAIKKATE